MRYMVGSALVTKTARSTRLLAGTGVFYSYRIRVKGEIAYTDCSLPGLTRPAFHSHLLFLHRLLGVAYST